MDRTYRNPSKPDEEISPEMRVKGYRYGAEYVPFNETDLQAMKVSISGNPNSLTQTLTRAQTLTLIPNAT